MKTIRLNTFAHTLTCLNNGSAFLKMFSYKSMEEYNKCEYYYKLFPAWRVTFLKGSPVDLEKIIGNTPTEVSYATDGSYLKVVWETHTIIIGSFPSGTVKTYAAPR